MPDMNLVLMHTKKEEGFLIMSYKFSKQRKYQVFGGPNPSFYGGKKTLLQAECLLTLILSSKMFHIQ